MTASVGIIGMGMYVPDTILTNDDLVEKGLDTSHEWIFERTGIKERRIVNDGSTSSDLGYEAAVNAIQDAELTREDIDLLIVATTTPDYKAFPSTASILQKRLGLNNIGAFDLSAACAGYTHALVTGLQYVKTGFCKNVLIIGVDCLSTLVDWEDRSTCILFGDGAGASVLSNVADSYGVLSASLHTQGEYSNILLVKGHQSNLPPEAANTKLDRVYMNGKSVFKVAVSVIVPNILNALKDAGLTIDDLDYLVCHQANVRIIENAREKLGLSKEQVIINIDRYGNTSAASVPIALTEAVKDGRIRDGHIVATIGFGAGFSYGTTVFRWGGKK
ncbi:MAG: ketoacyl-ACP synthase III [Candidatus Margulisbacteria bacterium]|nr:ketoacyl-ACP synthase III [Candidatus Margulisiibacteriota bacterium]